MCTHSSHEAAHQQGGLNEVCAEGHTNTHTRQVSQLAMTQTVPQSWCCTVCCAVLKTSLCTTITSQQPLTDTHMCVLLGQVTSRQ